MANNYKIICINTSSYKQSLLQAYVYSCNSDSWNQVYSTFANNRQSKTRVMIVNGQPYWLDTHLDDKISKRCLFGVSFDVHSEVLRVLPELGFFCYSETHWSVVNLKNALAVMVCTGSWNATVQFYVLLVFGIRCIVLDR